jgi:hypothetical protein
MSTNHNGRGTKRKTGETASVRDDLQAIVRQLAPSLVTGGTSTNSPTSVAPGYADQLDMADGQMTAQARTTMEKIAELARYDKKPWID